MLLDVCIGISKLVLLDVCTGISKLVLLGVCSRGGGEEMDREREIDR